MAPRIHEVAHQLLLAWQNLAVKPARPELRGTYVPEVDPGPEELLGSRFHVQGRPPADAILAPPITLVAVPPIPALPKLPPGEVHLWTPAVDVFAGHPSPRRIVIDPAPPPPPARFELKERAEPTRPWHRVSGAEAKTGYRWPMLNMRPIRVCRRGFQLRTDLARVVYPQIPKPGRLMRPMIKVDEGAEPWKPGYERGRIHIGPDDLRWDRPTDLRLGPPVRPPTRYLAPFTPPTTEAPAETPAEAPAPVEEGGP